MKDFTQYNSKLYHWFPQIPKSEINQIVIRQFEANETFIHKTDIFNHIFLILDGICNVINETDIHTQVITLRLSCGDLIGVSEMMLNSFRYISSIKCCTNLIVAEFDPHTFQEWLNRYPCFVNFVLKNLIIRLHYTADFSANCQSSTSKINLAKYFLDRYQFESSSTEFSKPVIIRETQEMMSHFLGMNTRTIQRHIRALKEDGLIDTKKGKVCISQSQYQKLLLYVTSNL